MTKKQNIEETIYKDGSDYSEIEKWLEENDGMEVDEFECAYIDGDLIRHVIEGESKKDAVLRFCGWNRTHANYILKNYKIVRVYG